MAKASDNKVVLKFETSGQVQYAKTVKDINSIMNAAAKEYRAHIKAMGDDASATSKLAAEKKKLETQLEAGRERTAKLKAEFENLKNSTTATTAQLNNMYGKVKDSEAAEASLERRLEQVNQEMSEQAEQSRENQSQLSKLQDESQQLASQTQKLNSEYDLLESQMGSNADETEKAALAQEKFGRQSEIVEQQISNLEKQLQLVKAEYGENSVEANKMETELNEAKTAFNNLNNEMKETGNSSDQAQDGMGKLTEVVKSQAMMDAAQSLGQISEKLIDIGKKSIETAANYKANKAQFDQTFGEMAPQATAIAEKLGQEFDMIPSRLTPGLSKMTSMFKGLGYDTAEAMGLAERAVRASADAAAFYDQSFEDANGALTSFLKGNYEAGESIGIFANDTQMAAFAIKNDLIPATEGAKEASEKQMIAVEKAQQAYANATAKYGEGSVQSREAALKLKEAQDEINAALEGQIPKWSELDEATKQAVRIEYAENMQQLAGATGQAARESEGYENQMGNAKAATDELMAAVGNEAMNMLLEALRAGIPIIQTFTQGFMSLSPQMQQAVIIIGGVIAGMGLLLPLFATVGLIVSTGMLPAIGILAAVAAAVAAIILVVKNWGSIMDWIKDKASQVSDWIKNKFQSIGDAVDYVKNAVKTKFEDMMENAKSVVRNGIERLKSFFKFSWSLPKLKLPHVKISGSFKLKPPSAPKFSVDWYSKGGIFTKPTIFGESNGRLKGAGEAGPEAALPLTDEVLGGIGRGIAATMSGGGVTQHIYFGKVDANNPSELNKINRQLERANRQAAYDLGGEPI